MSRIGNSASRTKIRKRANGEASRERILDAATDIAAERGYEGTSIALISKRSGLPASSIYWHFEDKDKLVAAVIERSFNRWLEGMGASVLPKKGLTRQERFAVALRRAAKALEDAPDFLRLGLMLTLERRPKQASARTLFLKVRDEAYRRTVASYQAFFGPEIDKGGVRALATLTMAAADGLFIAHEIDRSDVNFEAAFELLAAAVMGASKRLRSRVDHSKSGKSKGSPILRLAPSSQ